MSDERETIQRNPESVAAWKRECAFLREQVEKLTEECVVLRASNRTKLDTIAYLETREDENKQKLAALAEQNERMRVALQAMVDEAFARNCGLKIADDALSLPDLATPILSKYRAEGAAHD